MRNDIRSDVDFVLTFEEMAGIFDAKHVDLENIEEDPTASTTRPRTDGISPLPAASPNRCQCN